MMAMQWWLARVWWVFGVSFVVTLLSTPVFILLAKRWLVFDHPSQRKIHAEPVPRIGGLAIMLGVLVGMAGIPMEIPTRIGLMGGCLLLGLVGFADDVRGLRPGAKLLAQLLAAAWAVLWGIQISFIRLPYGSLSGLGLLSIPITIFWIVLMINAVNLIDGIDGLAAGITFIVGGAIFVAGMLLHHSQGLWFIVALLGALLAFLRYNFNPARVFMGDSGSMVCGFLIAVAAVLGVLKTTTTLALAMPVIAMGLPLTDTGLAVLRRLRSGRSIFSPDKQHVHHWMLAKGLTQRQVALTAYSITALLSALALLLLVGHLN